MVYELNYHIQKYDWGVKGRNSMVSKLCEGANPENFLPDENTPYAELWLGTHPNGESSVIMSGKKVYLSKLCQDHFEFALPYLLKVLSVGHVLSVQAHPNKEMAQKLHIKFPQMYKDSNHKPEMAVALSKFTAMCGFREPSDVLKFAEILPSFGRLIGSDLMDQLKKSGKQEKAELNRKLFEILIHRSSEKIKSEIEKTREIIFDIYTRDHLDLIEFKLFQQISSHYNSDFGCFSLFCLNVFELNPGEAIYLKANVPHAYISGDCIECMANSDNVIRLGLTGKFKDVSTAMEIVNFSPSELVDFIVSKETKFSNGNSHSFYAPPVSEFKICNETDRDWIFNIKQASTVLITKGSFSVEVFQGNETRIFLFGYGTAHFFEEATQIIKMSPVTKNGDYCEMWIASIP